jgi:hypothetical protein
MSEFRMRYLGDVVANWLPSFPKYETRNRKINLWANSVCNIGALFLSSA